MKEKKEKERQHVVYYYKCGLCDANYVKYTADTSISALRNTKDCLQSGITLKSNMEQSQVTQLYRDSKILRKSHSKCTCLIYKMLFMKELKPTLHKQSDSIRAKLLISFLWYFITSTLTF